MFKERPYDTRLHSTAIAQSVTVIAEVGKRHLQPSTLTILAALGFKSIQMLVFILPQHMHCQHEAMVLETAVIFVKKPYMWHLFSWYVVL